jgi:hypothetical protein
MGKSEIGYSDGANHLLKTGTEIGYSDGANHKIKLIEIGGADGANHVVWRAIIVGDTYTFGGYNWTVVNINASGQETLLCQSHLASLTQFATVDAVYKWSESALRTYLNGTFYNSLSSSEKAQIVSASHTSGWDTTSVSDNVWPLSMSEIFGTSFGGNTFVNDGAQLQYFSGKTAEEIKTIFGNDVWDWTRCSQSSTKVYSVGGAAGDGNPYFNSYVPTEYQYVRPAILINP